jgi:hypothetical protein
LCKKFHCCQAFGSTLKPWVKDKFKPIQPSTNGVAERQKMLPMLPAKIGLRSETRWSDQWLCRGLFAGFILYQGFC